MPMSLSALQESLELIDCMRWKQRLLLLHFVHSFGADYAHKCIH